MLPSNGRPSDWPRFRPDPCTNALLVELRPIRLSEADSQIEAASDNRIGCEQEQNDMDRSMNRRLVPGARRKHLSTRLRAGKNDGMKLLLRDTREFLHVFEGPRKILLRPR